jgi:hypothetical protein
MKANKQSSLTRISWHPNFRIVESLPDTKVIRTSFLVNSVSVAFLLAAATVFVLREQGLAEVRGQTSAFEARIVASTPRYTQAIKLQKEFSEAEKRLKEIEAFVTNDFVASGVLRQLADTLPKFLTLDSVAMNPDAMHLRGSIVGPDRKATDIATAYVALLKADVLFSPRLESVEVKSIDRVPEANRMVFEIEMKFKPRK